MANIYVSPTGSDTSGDGSQSNPYKHIYKAIQVASDNDTIICKSGTYNEENLQGSYPYLRAGLTIKSESENFEDVIVYADGWTGRNWFWGIESGYSPSLGKVTIRDITIKIGATGDNGKSLFYHYGANTCFDLVNLFVDGQNKSARTMWLRNGSDSKFYKCTFRNITSSDYFICFGWDYHAYTFNLDLKDCIFENIQTTLIHKGIDHTGSLNNDYNCLYNISNYGDYSLNTHDITSDPKFTSSSSAQIQNDSPCKNAGVTVTGYVEDYEGTAPDIGCYEIVEKIIITSKKATINSYNSVTLKGNISNLLGGSAYVWFKYRVIGSSTWNETSKELVTSNGDFTKTITTTTDDYEFKALGQNTESGSSIEEGDVLNFYIMDNDENVSLSESKNLKFIELFNEALSLNDTSLAKYVEKVIMSESLSLTEDKKLKFNLYNIENLNIADSKKFKYITFFSDSLSLNSESKRVEKDAYNPWIIAEVINNEFPMDVDSNGDGIVDNWEGEGLGEVSLIKDSYRNSVQEVEFLQNGRFYRQFSYNKKAIILFEIKPLFSVNFCIKQNNNIVYNYKFYSDDNWRLFLIPFTFNGDYVLEFNKEDYSYFYLDNFAIIDYNDYLKILEKKRPAPTEFGYNFEGGDIVNSFNENFSGNSPIKSDFSIKWDYSDFNHEKYLNNLINKKILVKTYLDEVFSFLILGINKSYHPNKQGRNQTYSLTLLVKEV